LTLSPLTPEFAGSLPVSFLAFPANLLTPRFIFQAALFFLGSSPLGGDVPPLSVAPLLVVLLRRVAPV
jgi:hypothetical protein